MRKYTTVVLLLFTIITFAQSDSKSQKNVLIIVSSYGNDNGTTRPGFEFEEFVDAYNIFTQNNILVTVASPKGGKVVADKFDSTKEKNLESEGTSVSEQFFEASKEQVAMAHRMAVPIMAGTDVTDSYVFAGFSLHDELYELTRSGLSNLEALQCATIVPATFSNLIKDYGTIEIGKKADLILLDKNPLDDIKNTKEINGVLLNGVYYDEEKLTELKAFTETAASSFHMNVKALISLVNSPLIRVQFAD